MLLESIIGIGLHIFLSISSVLYVIEDRTSTTIFFFVTTDISDLSSWQPKLRASEIKVLVTVMNFGGIFHVYPSLKSVETLDNCHFDTKTMAPITDYNGDASNFLWRIAQLNQYLSFSDNYSGRWFFFFLNPTPMPGHMRRIFKAYVHS